MHTHWSKTSSCKRAPTSPISIKTKKSVFLRPLMLLNLNVRLRNICHRVPPGAKSTASSAVFSGLEE